MNKSNTLSLRRLLALVALVVAAIVLLSMCSAPAPGTAPADTAIAPAEESAPAADTVAKPATAESEADTSVAATDSVTATGAATATETITAATDTTATTESEARQPMPTEEFNGIPVGFTADGFAFRGDPNAPITMIEYSDYQCPFCARYFVQTEPSINESYVRSGKMRVIFHDFPIVQLHPNAPAAHVASLCVADQGSAAVYWDMHNKLFNSASEWGPSTDPAPIFERLAGEVGADLDQYKQCIKDGAKVEIVDKRVQYAGEQGYNGTPTFQFIRKADSGVFELVGAQPYDEFAKLIDAVVAGESPETAQASQEGGGEIPAWAKPENLVADPDRPGYNLAGDEFKGSPDAPLVVIEYTDFQCPYCQRHAQETQPTLDKDYVDTGKVLWVFKHFPLDIHAQAPAAGIAAECASEQGKFWEMKELLFKEQATWSVSDPTPVFLDLAETLELDRDAFETCLKDPAMAERIESDKADGAPFVRGTPTFIVLLGEQGGIIPGALPADRFAEYFDQLLTEPDATPEATSEATPEAQ